MTTDERIESLEADVARLQEAACALLGDALLDGRNTRVRALADKTNEESDEIVDEDADDE